MSNMNVMKQLQTLITISYFVSNRENLPSKILHGSVSVSKFFFRESPSPAIFDRAVVLMYSKILRSSDWLIALISKSYPFYPLFMKTAYCLECLAASLPSSFSTSSSLLFNSSSQCWSIYLQKILFSGVLLVNKAAKRCKHRPTVQWFSLIPIPFIIFTVVFYSFRKIWSSRTISFLRSAVCRINYRTVLKHLTFSVRKAMLRRSRKRTMALRRSAFLTKCIPKHTALSNADVFFLKISAL